MLKELCLAMAAATAVSGSYAYHSDSTEKNIQVTAELNTKQVQVSYKRTENKFKDKKGNTMLKSFFVQPVMKNGYQASVMENINHYYAEQKKAFDQTASQYLKDAENDFNERDKEQKKYWQGYMLSQKYQEKRMDQKVISFNEIQYYDTQGAHPGSYFTAQNFSAETGKVLEFKDVVTDETQARKFIEHFIAEKVKTSNHPEYFFEDYEKHIKEILQQDTWYFSDQGFVIIANEYIITPHAIGMVEFTIPYNDFTYLKDEYKPQ